MQELCAGISVAALALLVLAAPAAAETLRVNSTSDPGTPGCGPFLECTLREQITAANGTTELDVIKFSVPLPATIKLQSQLPKITSRVVIEGPGALNLTIRAAAAGYRLFHLDQDIDNGATLQAMTLADADVRTAPVPNGGAIYTEGANGTRVERVHFTGNKAVNGGAIFNNDGELDVIDSSLIGNTASGDGGGIHSSGGGGGHELVITNSTIAENSADGSGGGIFNSDGYFFVYSSTIARNFADADSAGGGSGGGTYRSEGGGMRSAFLVNTLYAFNGHGPPTSSTPNQCNGNYYTGGYNLRTTADSVCNLLFIGPSDLVNPDPGISESPAPFGGQTPVFALLPGSPAIDAGNPVLPGSPPATTNACPEADQRGLPRGGLNDRCDIGAFEFQSSAPAVSPSPPFAHTQAGTKCKKGFRLKKVKRKGKKKKRRKCVRKKKKRKKRRR